MEKLRVATMWLDGCSGCHMSLLDIDERLLELAGRFELVYSPLVDVKEYPENVDVALVEGAVSSEEDRHRILTARARTRLLVSLGDCAVTSNVPSMRNAFSREELLHRAFVENATERPQIPTEEIPALLPRALPLHEVVDVDLYVPGCPPSADIIYRVLSEVLAGRKPDIATVARFG